MERDGFKCRECGDGDKTLHVHHFYYSKGKQPWEYEEDALITHCERCHSFVEESMDQIKRNIGIILSSRSLGIVTGSDVIKSIADFAQASDCAGECYGTTWGFLGQCSIHEAYLHGVRQGRINASVVELEAFVRKPDSTAERTDPNYAAAFGGYEE